MKKLAVVAVVVSVLCLIGAVPRILRKNALQDAQAALNQPRLVTVAVTKRGAQASTLILPGTALPIESAAIYARINGFVREIRADLGDRVAQGAVLAVLDTPELQADALSVRARMAEHERNVKLAQATADRYASLSETGVASKQQADETAARANSAQAAYTSSKAEVERVESMLAFRHVTAPFAGVITRRSVDRGALVTAGSNSGISSLFDIARTDTLKVYVDVPQALASGISIGDAAQVSANGGTPVPGKVVRSAGALDPASRTMRVEVHVPGDKAILSGSFVRVTLTSRTEVAPIIVPASALVSKAGKSYVFSVDDAGTVKPHLIQIGRDLGVEIEVADGLSGTEKVIVNAPENLSEGEHVRTH